MTPAVNNASAANTVASTPNPVLLSAPPKNPPGRCPSDQIPVGKPPQVPIRPKPTNRAIASTTAKVFSNRSQPVSKSPANPRDSTSRGHKNNASPLFPKTMELRSGATVHQKASKPATSCESCGIRHDRSYGSGRFCSVHCARRVGASRKWEKQRNLRRCTETNLPCSGSGEAEALSKIEKVESAEKSVVTSKSSDGPLDPAHSTSQDGPKAQDTEPSYKRQRIGTTHSQPVSRSSPDPCDTNSKHLDGQLSSNEHFHTSPSHMSCDMTKPSVIASSIAATIMPRLSPVPSCALGTTRAHCMQRLMHPSTTMASISMSDSAYPLQHGCQPSPFTSCSLTSLPSTPGSLTSHVQQQPPQILPVSLTPAESSSACGEVPAQGRTACATPNHGVAVHRLPISSTVAYSSNSALEPQVRENTQANSLPLRLAVEALLSLRREGPSRR